jgi:hypothetical protein
VPGPRGGVHTAREARMVVVSGDKFSLRTGDAG